MSYLYAPSGLSERHIPNIPIGNINQDVTMIEFEQTTVVFLTAAARCRMTTAGSLVSRRLVVTLSATVEVGERLHREVGGQRFVELGPDPGQELHVLK